MGTWPRLDGARETGGRDDFWVSILDGVPVMFNIDQVNPNPTSLPSFIIKQWGSLLFGALVFILFSASAPGRRVKAMMQGRRWHGLLFVQPTSSFIE
jgi:hypothetical protein